VIAWLAYASTLACLVACAALAADAAARVLRLPRRGIWAASLAVSVLVPLNAWWPRIGGGRAAPSPRPGTAEIGTLGELVQVTTRESASMLEAWLAAAALAACTLTLATITVGAVRLSVRRRGWRAATMDGHPVLVSRDTGPAVAGVVRGEIVVPRWAFALDPADRACLLAHERSHLQARDPLLFAASLVLASLAAWNPIVWWQLGRLRLAIELDCDARVVAALGDPGRYGRALLAVGALRAGRTRPLIAFAERSHHLERRILDMTEPRPRYRARRAFAFVAAGAIAVAGACAIPRPTTPAPDLSLTALRGASGVDLVPAPRSLPSAHAPTPARESSTAARPPAADPTPLAVDTPAVDVGDRPAFTPRTREPELPADQRRALLQYLERNYPEALRDAGVGARTTLWVFIDAQGRTANTTVAEPSGYPAFDEVAQRALRIVTWHPAMNREERVPVWIQLPLAYQVRVPRPDADPDGSRSGGMAEPRLLNADEVIASARRAAGAARGRAQVWISVHPDGSVGEVRLAASSGNERLDQAALMSASGARFEPAHDGREPIPVWIRFPVVVLDRD
jgi:TonB family protein